MSIKNEQEKTWAEACVNSWAEEITELQKRIEGYKEYIRQTQEDITRYNEFK